MTRERKTDEIGHWKKVSHPLAPLYCKHLRTLTMRDALIWCNSITSYAAAPQNSRGCVFDKVLELARSSESEELEGHPDNGMDLETCIGKCDTDITRT